MAMAAVNLIMKVMVMMIPLETLIVPIRTSFTFSFSHLPHAFGTICSTQSFATKTATVLSMSWKVLPIRKFLKSSLSPFISRSALDPCGTARFHCTLRFPALTVAMVILSLMMKMPISRSLTYVSSFSFIPRIPYSSGVANICHTLPSMALMAMVVGSFITMMLPFIKSLTYSSSFFLIKHKPSLSRVRRTPCVTMMVTVSLMMMMMPMSTSLTCPTNCSTISPLPYPFGAHPGCGLPGFQLTDCTIPTPLWNLTVAGTPHSYYIKSVHSNPNYGYSGTVQIYLNSSTADPPTCGLFSSSSPLNNFTTSNFYAFKDANLSYYQVSYLFFNCTASLSSPPDTGLFTPSSPSCRKYLSHCNLSMTMSCLEYVPYKELQLASLMTAYKCSSLRRFVITDVNDPVSAWVPATQFAWDEVAHADSCSSCQSSGGTCGYDTQDDTVFQCHCSDGTHTINCHQGSGRGKIIGVAVSFAVIFLLVLLGIAYYYRHECYYYSMFRKEHLNLDGVNQAPLELPYGALAAATKSFSSKIGQGAFGKVYQGMLFGGMEVAVKVLDASVSHTDGQFINEVATIGNIHHVNIARLVGFCFQKSRRILVYEYVSNGSLDKYLFPSKKSSSDVVLTWKQRYDIALGIARGLCYMHEDCRSCIIHCDIKPQNILLDDAFCPKIADFGLARLLTREESRVLTQARGTPGYVAPEFWSLGSGPLSAKFDVYSYGIVLLEIIGGKRGIDDYERLFKEETEDEVNAWMSVSVDKRIEHDVDVEQVKLCTLVAFWCIQDNPNLRPTMSNVVQFLQGTAPVPSNPPKPFKNVFQEDSSQVNSSDFLLSSSEKVFSITLSRDRFSFL